MATNTTNYNFKKPDESDFYSIQDQNGNWDKADAALKDLDTPTFEDYSGGMAVPDAATAIGNIKSKGKLSTTLSNIKAAFKGACLIGQIVNNCVTDNAKLPLSAAQGKALMDLYTVLNSNLVRIDEGLVNLKIRIYKENRYFQKGKSIIESAAPNTFTSNVVCCASMEDTSLGLIVTASMYTVANSSITLDCRSVSTGELYTGWANIQVTMIGF